LKGNELQLTEPIPYARSYARASIFTTGGTLTGERSSTPGADSRPRARRIHARAAHARRAVVGPVLGLRCAASLVVSLARPTGLPALWRGRPAPPDVVWFGELPYGLAEVEPALVDADLFVSVGTSGAIHPAAGWSSTSSAAKGPCTSTRTARHGPAGLLVPAWADDVLQE
jgi:hypothetical protein